MTVPVKHGPAGLQGQVVPRVLPDRTGCVHRIIEVWGVAECSRCGRLLEDVQLEDGSWALRVAAVQYPPGPTE